MLKKAGIDMYYVNEDIKNCVRIFPEQGRYDYLRYDMNENPEGLPKAFVEEVLKELTPEFLAVYPEPDLFIRKYADYLGVRFDNICVTNGSDMAIRYVMEVFAKRGNNVVTVTPSFEMYGVNCSMLGLNQVAVEYDRALTISTDRILAAIDKDTDIVVLLNPNNPIGTVYSDEDALKIIKKAEAVGAVVVIDEAYHYFYKNTFLKYAMEFNHVMVFRTFSKLCSLAGVRIGAVVGHPDLIGYIKKARPTFDTNAVALKFAERIMDHPEMLEELMTIEEEGRAYAVGRLKEHGYEYYAENGNFVFIKPNQKVSFVKDALREKKILVKTYGNELLKDFIRVSTGSKNAMEKFLDAFFEADHK